MREELPWSPWKHWKMFLWTKVTLKNSQGLEQAWKWRRSKTLSIFLKKSTDVFAWSHEDMPSIDPSVITYRLNKYSSFKPVLQKKRVFAPEWDKAIKEEVQKLTMVKFIQEVYYSNWLANVVMVKKANSKWRMCVDFTDLNKTCSKDSYPLPRID